MSLILNLFHEHFVWPWVLLFLLVVPPTLALFFWWREQSRQKMLARFIEARLLSALTVGVSPQRRKIRFALLILASVFLIMALARPRYGYDLQEVEENGLDVVVAVDTSKSMLARDVVPDRLQRAKLAALELMQDANSDRLGLVAFAGQAFLECPLTADAAAFEQSVQTLDVNSVSQGGTGIANAISAAETAFKENGHSKTIVLLTDGEDNVNEAAALDAAKEAAKNGVKIFTIGIGTPEGEFIRIAGPDGNSDFVRDSDGNVVKSHLNEALLREIAGATGGFYLPLRGANVMDALYERGLAPLPKAQGTEKQIRIDHEWFQIPLVIAILLLLTEMLVPERTRTKGIVQPAVQPFIAAPQPAKITVAGTGELPPVIGAVVLVAFLLSPRTTLGSPDSALHDYNSGHFTNALTEYSRLSEVQTNDFRLVFNAGDAAYRTTNFDLAQALFQDVTLAPDINLQQKAYYNLGNAQFQMAKQSTDLDGVQAGFEIAQKSYQRAFDLNTNDVDAKFNLQYTRDMIERIKEFRAMMLKAKSEADDDVRMSEFHKALEIMAPLQAKLEKTVMAKQFEDFTKRLKQIDDIETPHSQ
jgi:Ca-activated chloride channel family protein